MTNSNTTAEADAGPLPPGPDALDRGSGRIDQLGVSRRRLLTGAAAVGVVGAAGALAACGSGGNETSGNGPVTIPAADVPVGGGKVISADKIVVTQPTAGTYKAFSAVCTHQGCIVDGVANGTIRCPCHFSRFSITDGSPVSGPAPTPLPARTVTVQGTTLTVT
jgi:nitrite reductase/ring-hydroxylating ferredoxin subunit